MMISTKGRYALRIMIDLALNSNEHPIPLKEICERQGITIKYMEQIIPMLTKAGYLKSFRGSNGGYQLTRNPSEYTLGDILRTTEGNMAPVACLETEKNTCARKDTCITLPVWEGLWKVINEYIDSVTLEDFLQEGKTSPTCELEYYI